MNVKKQMLVIRAERLEGRQWKVYLQSDILPPILASFKDEHWYRSDCGDIFGALLLPSETDPSSHVRVKQCLTQVAGELAITQKFSFSRASVALFSNPEALRTGIEFTHSPSEIVSADIVKDWGNKLLRSAKAIITSVRPYKMEWVLNATKTATTEGAPF